MSGSALATMLAIVAGPAGSVQVAVMSRLGERIGVGEARAVIDRWGLFGSGRIALHRPRLFGIALLAVGVALSLRK